MWGCFSHDHKLDLKVVRQTLTGQHFIEDILEPIVCIHISKHIKKRTSYFRTTMSFHIGHVLLQNLLDRRVLEIFSG